MITLPRTLACLVILLGLWGATAVAQAQQPAPAEQQPAPAPAPSEQPAPGPSPAESVMPPVLVTAPPPVSSSSQQLIPGKDFELRPQGRPADVLRLIPGLIIGQHQGGGKADQYLIRGFDADHGTDIALFVDGMPVNLRSHAHGQGYADLHFLIPETVAGVDVFKGPYYAEFGDFDTAAAVRFRTLDVAPENTLQVAGGSWNTQRYVALLSPTRDAVKTLFAAELYHSDGPFEHPSLYSRVNVFGKATAQIDSDITLSVSASYYQALWHGSGQIPERAVRSGLIDRFGTIDPSEGGKYTQRDNLVANYTWNVTDNQTLTANAYLTYYELSLFNDFTFFLNDPVLGDEINQRDQRFLGGLGTQYAVKSKPFGTNLTTTAGVQYRIDTPRVTLATATQRHQTGVTQDVSIVEQSYSPFVQFDLVPVDKVRLVAGLREDVFIYRITQHVNNTDQPVNGAVTRARLNEKVNLILGPWAETEFFANFGTGFHSNDARAVLANPSQTALPTATGYEFGVKTRILPRVDLSATYWFLNLQSELVFNSDDGTTTALGATHREGLEFATKIRLLDWLTFDGAFTYTTHANFLHPTLAATPDPVPGTAIPLAPIWTARADLTARLPWGLSSDLGMIYVGNRALDPLRQQTARGYTLVNWTGRYRYKNLEAFLSIENLLNTEWREAQFFFASRLPGEPATGVPDTHFVPGNPRTFLGGLALRF